MNSRPLVPLQRADLEIWQAIDARWSNDACWTYVRSPLWVLSTEDDRRDADLMFKLVQARVAWRALYRLYGPLVDPTLWDQVGDGPEAVPLPQLRL